jgi:hypothetical protein
MIVAPRLYIVSSFHNASRSNNIVQYVFRATRRRSNELNLPTLVAPFALLYNHRQTSLRPDSRVTMSEVNTCPTTIVAADLSLCSAPFIVNCGKRIAIGSSWLAACCFLFIFFLFSFLWSVGALPEPLGIRKRVWETLSIRDTHTSLVAVFSSMVILSTLV